MLSVYYQNSNCQENLITENLSNFYNEISNYIEYSDRVFNKYHLAEYGEMTVVNFFINGIVRNELHNPVFVLNEFGLEEIEGHKTGRADVILEDIVERKVYYVETKIACSNENAVSTDIWNKPEKIKNDYNSILRQADKYLQADWKNYYKPELITQSGQFIYDFYKVALVFDSVRFKDENKIADWNYIPKIENEFYAFKSFPLFKSDEIFLDGTKAFGLATYGIVEKVDVPQPNS